MDELEVSLGDKRVEIASFDRYKGRKNETDMVGVISATLLRAYTHYKDKTFRCLSTPESRGICCEQLGEPTQRFGLVLFHYTADNKGDLIDQTKCSGKIKLWVISEAKYEELSALDKKWPLLDRGYGQPQHDMVIRCTEEQYQRMSITPCPSAHWKSKESWFKAIKDKEKKAKDRLKLALGRTMTVEEVMSLLGASIPSQTGGTEKAGDIDLSDILDE